MRSAAVPAALAERLGESGSAALVEMFGARTRACTDEVMTQSAERFERRLVEEASKLRVEMAQLGASLRQEMGRGDESLRQEMTELRADLRGEMTTLRGDLLGEMTRLRGDLREEMARLGGDLREEMASGRFELLKWAFLFWVGQIVSVVGFVGLLLRTMPR